MNEGRAELQRVIMQYEKQRAEAIRSKQEAEIVLPFVRAALEELDSALGQTENSEVMERVQSQIKADKARTPQPPRAAPAPAAAPRYEADSLDADRSPGEPEAPAPGPSAPAFGRASIASLLDDAKKKDGTHD